MIENSKMEKDAVKKTVMELKQELQRVRILMEEAPTATVDDGADDLELRFTESAIHTLRALKEMKLKQSDGGLTMLKNLGLQLPPKELLCPITGLLMTDPVVIDNGQTYDMDSIRKWMREGNTKCPRTNEELGRTHSTPNCLLKAIILNWCKQHQMVMEEDDDDSGFVHDAFQTLYGLRELKLNQEPPQEFLCPISGILMTDPVVASSGQTFDSAYIQSWLIQGNTKCPKTDQLLTHSVLIPNHSIREMIAKWCKANGLRPPPRPSSEHEDIEADESLTSLLKKFPSLNHSHQEDALRDIRFLSTRLPFFRRVLSVLSPLFTPYMIQQYKDDAAVYCDAVATILNITIDDRNRANVVNDCPHLVPFLILALHSQNTIEIRGYAAAALCELSEIDINKILIGESGAVKPLFNLLDLGHPLASREAASAVLSLIARVENKEQALSIGGLSVVIDKLEDHALFDKILEILVLFTNHPRAVEYMGQRGLMPRLFSIIVETRCRHVEENCVVVICAIACSEQRRLRDVEKVADALEILYGLSNNGTARARKLAYEILFKIKGKHLASVKIK